MNLPRRQFLGNSLVLLGSQLLDSLATPLWKWTRPLVVEAASLPNSPVDPGVKFVDVGREAGLNTTERMGRAGTQALHHRSQGKRHRLF